MCPINRFGDRYGAGWSETEEAWLDAIMEMGGQKHHIEELADLTGRTVCAIINRINLRLVDTRMGRRQFSNHVMRENAKFGMTAEQFAEAVGQPLETILRRAQSAGIEMPREKFMIARGVPKARADDPAIRSPCVHLELRSLS